MCFFYLVMTSWFLEWSLQKLQWTTHHFNFLVNTGCRSRKETINVFSLCWFGSFHKISAFLTNKMCVLILIIACDIYLPRLKDFLCIFHLGLCQKYRRKNLSWYLMSLMIVTTSRYTDLLKLLVRINSYIYTCMHEYLLFNYELKTNLCHQSESFTTTNVTTTNLLPSSSCSHNAI